MRLYQWSQSNYLPGPQGSLQVCPSYTWFLRVHGRTRVERNGERVPVPDEPRIRVECSVKQVPLLGGTHAQHGRPVHVPPGQVVCGRLGCVRVHGREGRGRQRKLHLYWWSLMGRLELHLPWLVDLVRIDLPVHRWTDCPARQFVRMPQWSSSRRGLVYDAM